MDSDRQMLAHRQLEYGSTNTHSMCTNSSPAIVIASAVVHVKSVCAASPGLWSCASITSLSGPRSAPGLHAALQSAQLPLLVASGYFSTSTANIRFDANRTGQVIIDAPGTTSVAYFRVFEGRTPTEARVVYSLFGEIRGIASWFVSERTSRRCVSGSVVLAAARTESTAIFSYSAVLPSCGRVPGARDAQDRPTARAASLRERWRYAARCLRSASSWSTRLPASAWARRAP